MSTESCLLDRVTPGHSSDLDQSGFSDVMGTKVVEDVKKQNGR